jgi:hypothetical protein
MNQLGTGPNASQPLEAKSAAADLTNESERQGLTTAANEATLRWEIALDVPVKGTDGTRTTSPWPTPSPRRFGSLNRLRSRRR